MRQAQSSGAGGVTVNGRRAPRQLPGVPEPAHAHGPGTRRHFSKAPHGDLEVHAPGAWTAWLRRRPGGLGPGT